MTNEKTSATPPSHPLGWLGRIGRMVIFFLTAGFGYPNVFVENLDATKHDAKFHKKVTAV